MYAVDGGFTALADREIEASKVFGDFDSLGYKPDHPCVRGFDSHKDFTDMDLAIQEAEADGFDELVLCNAFEGRIDHTLGNLQLLIKFAAQGQRIWGVNDEFAIVPLIAPGPFSCLSFAAGAKGTCSVINHSNLAEGVNEDGLEYSISGGITKNTSLWGISNELIGAPASISIERGSAWVFFPLEELPRAKYGERASRKQVQ
ncbi:MAG: thiamine diphosphokinase [Coriobacteriia bacterium]|nr:thiamine diphosphokinase [Coriobacteriia bacterium]